MTIVSARKFRANQGRYFGMVNRCEHVVLTSRMGRFRLMPIVEEEEEPKEEFSTKIRRSLQNWKDYLEGDESKMLSWEEMMDKLRS